MAALAVVPSPARGPLHHAEEIDAGPPDREDPYREGSEVGGGAKTAVNWSATGYVKNEEDSSQSSTESRVNGGFLPGGGLYIHYPANPFPMRRVSETSVICQWALCGAVRRRGFRA
jgi:hypothetical protein